MAEPVIVPIELEVTDIALDFNASGINKELRERLSGVRKTINDIFSEADPSTLNKSIIKSMKTVENALARAEVAQRQYSRTLATVGKSTGAYKEALKELEKEQRKLQEIDDYKSQFEDDSGNLRKDLNAHMLKEYPEVAKQYFAQLSKVTQLQNDMAPENFALSGTEDDINRVNTAYMKVINAITQLNNAQDVYNETVKDNSVTDEYTQMVKQAEAYKTKLEELAEKSKRMETLGATDKQWEALKYDTEKVSSEMDTLIKKMRAAVTSGKAFRLGEGDKTGLRSHINSLAKSKRDNVGSIQNTAQNNQSPYTEDYQKALNDLDKLEKKVESLRAKSAKMVELGASKKQFENLAYDAETLDGKVDEVKNSLISMVESGKAFRFGNGDVDAEMGKVRDKAAGMQSSLEGIATSAKNANMGFASILATFGKVARVMGKIASGTGKVVSGIGKVASGLISSIKNMDLFGKASTRTSRSANTGFSKLGRNILMFGFGFRTLYYAVKSLRNTFMEAFTVMGDQFDEVGQPMMRLTESFNRLKGSIATAFQPIVSIVIPYLTKFLNYLSGVLEAIGKFNAALTGQGYIYKTIAKDINSVSKAAKNANKQLASYDKLEVISDDNAGYDFEKQTLGEADAAASNFANMVKAAWEKADFKSVGIYVTEQLLNVLDNVEKNIVPKVTAFVNKLLTSINTFFDGFDSKAIGDKVGSIFNVFIDGIKWDQIGMLFANLNNVVWEFFDGLVNKIDWTMLGESLNMGLIGLVNNLNFASLAGMVTGLTMGILTAIQQIDWAHLANTLLTGLQTILNTLGEAMASSNNPLIAGFGEVILAINEAITLLKPAIETIIESISPIVQAILPVISKLLPPIAEIVSNVVNTLLPPLVTLFGKLLPPIINLVDSLLPAINTILSIIMDDLKQVVDIITYVVMPVVSFLIDNLSNTIDIIGAVLRVFTGDFNAIGDVFNGLLKAWKSPINAIIVLVESLVNGVIVGINSMIRALNRISFDIPDWVPALGGKSFGFNIRELSTITIPRLAQGAVIPPNKEFLAMLGDQKHGTNIEAPLDTIKQALAEVLAEMGGGGSKEPIVLQVNGRTLAKVVWDEQEKRYKQTGRYSMA